MSPCLNLQQLCCRLPVDSKSKLRPQAGLHIIKTTQAVHVAAEISATLAQDKVARSSKLGAFRLLLDADGLLQARTRLTRGLQITYDERDPIIIPANCRLVVLLVLHHHRTNANIGVSAILNVLTRRFWIVRGRQLIKKLLGKCVVCRRSQGPSADRVRAPLPVERISLIAPFAVAGVDSCGPFYTR